MARARNVLGFVRNNVKMNKYNAHNQLGKGALMTLSAPQKGISKPLVILAIPVPELMVTFSISVNPFAKTLKFFAKLPLTRSGIDMAVLKNPHLKILCQGKMNENSNDINDEKFRNECRKVKTMIYQSKQLYFKCFTMD